MTKRKRKITTVEEVEPEDELEPVIPDDLDDDPLEEKLREIVGSASSFTVFRLPAIGQPGKRTFCATYQADDLGEQGLSEFVAERWGGGRFLIAPRGNSGAILKNQVVEIDKSVKPKVDVEPARDGGKSELVDLLREVIRDSRSGGGGQSMSEIQAEIIRGATTQAAAMAAMMQPIFAQMAEMMKPEKTPWETLTPMLTAALEIGAEARGGGNGEGGPASYLPLIEKFAGILDRAQRAGHVPGEPPAKINPPPKKEETPFVVTPNEPGWVKGLRPYLPFVLAQAKDDVPPEFLLGELEARAPRIVDWLAERDPETWPGELAAFVPELQPYTVWVKRFLEALQAGEDEDELPEAPNPSGE